MAIDGTNTRLVCDGCGAKAPDAGVTWDHDRGESVVRAAVSAGFVAVYSGGPGVSDHCPPCHEKLARSL